MLAADWLYPVHIDLLTYMLVKYCLGFFFLLVFPMAVLICHQEVWRETVRIFKAQEGRREQTQEEKEAEIGKQMLDFSR